MSSGGNLTLYCCFPSLHWIVQHSRNIIALYVQYEFIGAYDNILTTYADHPVWSLIIRTTSSTGVNQQQVQYGFAVTERYPSSGLFKTSIDEIKENSILIMFPHQYSSSPAHL